MLSTYGGLHERIYCDHDNPADTLIKTAQDCQPTIEENKVLAENGCSTADGSWTLVARFPSIFWDKALREGWANDQKKWDQLCNDPDYAGFRVWKGKV